MNPNGVTVENVIQATEQNRSGAKWGTIINKYVGLKTELSIFLISARRLWVRGGEFVLQP